MIKNRSNFDNQNYCSHTLTDSLCLWTGHDEQNDLGTQTSVALHQAVGGA